MNKNQSHNRRSIRLKNYDYSSEGAYFITICSHNRECIFGNIEQGNMRLNEFGKIAHNEWMRTPEIRDNVVLDEFIVMPNHMHAVFMIVGAYRDTPLHPNRNTPLHPNHDTPLHPNRNTPKQKQNISQYHNSDVSQQDHGAILHSKCDPVTQIIKQTTTSVIKKPGLKSPSNTVGAIVRGYKSAVTNQINQIRKVRGVPVWQRNYYEHIIRDEESLLRIREYILTNPQKWDEDRNNPLNHKINDHDH